jgi:hypothetical protein
MKFIDQYYNMYIKMKKINQVHYNMMTKYIIFWNDNITVRTGLLKMEVKSLNPHTCNLGCVGYLGLKWFK